MAQAQDYILPAAITTLHCIQMALLALAVGKLRRKHGVNPPAVTGPDEFNRGFRAQQNCLEFMTMFLASLWVSAVFFNEYFASLAGLLYIWGRHNYFRGYVEKPGRRLRAFGWVRLSITVLLYSSIAGLAHAALLRYGGIDLVSPAKQYLNQHLKTLPKPLNVEL